MLQVTRTSDQLKTLMQAALDSKDETVETLSLSDVQLLS
jgi:hypothetical protein